MIDFNIRPISGWQRFFFYRKESIRTTWKLRFSILILAFLLVWVTRGYWTVKIGQSLTCEEQIRPSDALLLENFDPDYLVFERASTLRRAGVASRVLVPVQAAQDLETPSNVSEGIANVMSTIAHIPTIEVIPIPEIEPISLNAAKHLRDVLIRKGVKSIVLVTPGFRSRRSYIVYNAVFTPAGIAVHCAPVFGPHSSDSWSKSWHGIQDVALQFLKLQYYRFYVRP
jgi:hypothetical protein